MLDRGWAKVIEILHPHTTQWEVIMGTIWGKIILAPTRRLWMAMWWQEKRRFLRFPVDLQENVKSRSKVMSPDVRAIPCIRVMGIVTDKGHGTVHIQPVGMWGKVLAGTQRHFLWWMTRDDFKNVDIYTVPLRDLPPLYPSGGENPQMMPLWRFWNQRLEGFV